MPNTYTQIHIHIVFAVKYREALIADSWREDLHKFITGMVQQYGHKIIAVNSMPDHVHIFLGFRTTQTLCDLIRIVKGESSQWINRTNLTVKKFRWQEGYGAFSYARSQIKVVARYIENQQKTHKKKNFVEEYKHILESFDVEYDPKYIFTMPE